MGMLFWSVGVLSWILKTLEEIRNGRVSAAHVAPVIAREPKLDAKTHGALV
jgi:hypothetical protein